MKSNKLPSSEDSLPNYTGVELYQSISLRLYKRLTWVFTGCVCSAKER